MQAVNESVYLKKVFQAVGPRPRPRPTRGRGHIHEAEAAKNWPRGLTSLLENLFTYQTADDRGREEKEGD